MTQSFNVSVKVHSGKGEENFHFCSHYAAEIKIDGLENFSSFFTLNKRNILRHIILTKLASSFKIYQFISL